MRLDDPWALDLSYTRKVMSFLLFRAAPRRILMVGLGGGSLAKYCYRHLPLATVDAVEHDDDVIALRDYFFIPRASPRLSVIAADGARYVAKVRRRYDVVICDAFEDAGIAASVGRDAFYENACSALNPGGILVANLAGPTEERRRHLAMMTRIFPDVLLVPVEGEGNEIVLAFRQGMEEPGWPSIHERARALQGTFGLDFPRFASRLERSRKLGYARRTLAAV
ncbi:MAG: spermine/spermidine synthase domain-containing protein [Usitatibacter sp.]